MNPEAHSFRRKDIRIPEFDYSQPGAFFVTIVTKDRKTLFGQVNNGKMVLNNVGKLAEEVWLALPTHFPNVELGEWVIMPNHIHGILFFHRDTVGADCVCPKSTELGKMLAGYKSAVSSKLKMSGFTGNVWQRNYYEHIIHNEEDLNSIIDYIVQNPLNWSKDTLHTAHEAEK